MIPFPPDEEDKIFQPAGPLSYEILRDSMTVTVKKTRAFDG